MRRTWPIYLLLVLLLGAFLSFAWLTRNPTAPLAQEAETWPLIGPAVAQVRRAYLPPESSPQRLPSPPPEVVIVGGREEVPADAPPRLPEDPEITRLRRVIGMPPFEWLRAGAVLRVAPELGAPELITLARPMRVTLLGKQEEWLRVRFGPREAWVERAAIATEPPFGSDPLPMTELPPAKVDYAGQRRAIALLEDPRPLPLGGYTLYTDLPNQAALGAYLEPVLEAVEGAYAERYGLRPGPPPVEPPAVVIYARAEAYEQLRRSEPMLAAVTTSGHATAGLVALNAERRDRDSVAKLVVHEVTHMLNRRTFMPSDLPLWLEEGLAEDLANSRIDERGQLHPEQLGGQVRRRYASITYRGGQASLRQLLSYAEGKPPRTVAELMATPRDTFLADPLPYYAQAAFWVRYLVEEPQLRPGFQRFLRAVAQGEEYEVSAASLQRYLGQPWPELETGFATWMSNEVQREMPEALRLLRRGRFLTSVDSPRTPYRGVR